MLVTDSGRARLPLLDLVTAAVAGGVDSVYLRDVALPLPDLIRLVQEIRRRIGDGIGLLVNGGPETARGARTGLHLRERDIDVAAARAQLPPATLLGRSVHSVAAAAGSAGADYVLAGHVFLSASKPGLPPLGLDGLGAIAAAAPCPTLAIGGITPKRVAEVVRAGAAGIAVIGAIVEADDPRAATAALRAALDEALQEMRKEPGMSQEATTIATSIIGIVVNGKSITVPSGATVHDFLASKRMTDAMAIVERNGEIVARGDYAATPLQPDDVLEVVHAVGGG
jgi:thiazole tautomerase (transcriptional regulator TenI)